MLSNLWYVLNLARPPSFLTTALRSVMVEIWPNQWHVGWEKNNTIIIIAGSSLDMNQTSFSLLLLHHVKKDISCFPFKRNMKKFGNVARKKHSFVIIVNLPLNLASPLPHPHLHFLSCCKKTSCIITNMDWTVVCSNVGSGRKTLCLCNYFRIKPVLCIK